MSDANNGVTTIDELMSQVEGDAQQAYSTASEFDNWMPPDGQYTAVLGAPSFKTFNNKKTGKPSGIVELPHTLMGPAAEKLERKDFVKSFFTDNKVDLATLKALTGLLVGDAPDQLREALQVLESSAPGRASQLKVSRSPNKGNPERPYVNIKYLAVSQDKKAVAAK